MNKYSIKQIKEFVADESKFDELSVYDGMVMRRVVEAVASDGDKSMNSLLDRVLGKPTQYVKQEIDQRTIIAIEERKAEAEAEAKIMLEGLSQRVGHDAVVH